MTSVALNQQNVFITVRLLNTDGTPATAVVASTAGHRIWYRRSESALVTDAAAAANLASLTTAHTDWQFLHIVDGYYTVAYPDAAFLEDAGEVLCGMDATDISCVAANINIDPILKYQGVASAVTALTTTFPAGTSPDVGDIIVAASGTGVKQQVLVTSVAGEVATHGAWQRTNISATTTTILLIGGDDVTAQGGSNADAASSTLSTVTTVQVGTEVDDALVAIGLDHLVQTSVAGADVTNNSIIAQIVASAASADWDTFDNTTESLQALRDQGDAAWATGSGTLLASGTAQVGSTASTIKLAAAETFADDELIGNVVKIVGGVGAGQSRIITDNVSIGDVVTISPNWITTPTNTSVYEVVNGASHVASMEAGVIVPATFAANAIDAAAIAAGAIDAATFATGAINAAAIATDAITSVKIAANAIGASELATDAIGAAQIATNAIDASALAADAVTEIAVGTWAEVLGGTTMSASALLQIVAGVASGKISGAATSTVTIRDIEDAANLIVATVDVDGNRSAITITTPSD